MIPKTWSLIGIACGVAAVVTAIITAGWSVFSIIILLLSFLSFLTSWWLSNNKGRLWQKRIIHQNTHAIVFTVAVLLILGWVNWTAIRYDIRWDLTENQIHTLSSQSQAMVAELTKPLEVLIFDSEVDPYLENLLDNYRRAGNKFDYRFIDPEQEIGLAREYNIQSLGEIYLQYGDQRQKLNIQNQVVGESLTETQLTNEIAKIKRERANYIYLLQGHGEATPEFVARGIAQMVEGIVATGNIVKELNLAQQGQIPQDANLIAIVGAKRKFLAAEVTSLQTYLNHGGSLLLLLSPNIDVGLTPLLQSWGVRLDHRLIVDGSGTAVQMGFGPGVIIASSYGKHPITDSFGQGITIFPESRPIFAQAKSAIVATPLVLSEPQTWAESDLRHEEITFDSSKDRPGPLNIAIALEKTAPQTSHMVVFGSSTFATNGWFEQQLNSDLLLNSISWLLQETEVALAVRPQETANRRLNLSLSQTLAIEWLALRIFPISALVIAFTLWQRRC